MPTRAGRPEGIDMAGASRSPQDDTPKLFDSGEIETLRREREHAAGGGERPARHPWPVLADHFPRIAQAVFDLWGTPECDAYLARLIVDDRGTRSGFPPEVLQALLDLSAQHQRQFGLSRSGPLWLADPR
jgi:hypothetical protein